MFLCTKRSLTRSKELSLSQTFLSCLASLPESLSGRVTPYPISYPDAYLDFYSRLCPSPYPSHYLEPYLSCYLSRTRVLPEHVPDRVNTALPEHLLGRVKSYPITYPTLPDFLT
jgi:hypothetical protein